MNNPMKRSLLRGVSFGLTSGVITTLGMMIGLSSFSGSKLVVIGGILTIAIADAFSDALGQHILEESINKKSKNVWTATISTFLTKFIFALTFVIPVMLFELQTAVIVSVIWGLLILGILSFYIAIEKKEKPYQVIGEHLLIAVIVIILTHYVGKGIAIFFS